jgi:hypothetical protein
MLSMIRACDLDALFILLVSLVLSSNTNPVLVEGMADILHNSIIIRARDDSQPNAVGAMEDEGVEGADAVFIST